MVQGMELIRVAVCDDDQAAIGIIASSLKDIFASRGFDARVSLFSSAVELEQVINHRKFNLLLLDIEMPDLDGISFARALREAGDDVDIMYISSREDKVFESLRVSPVGFIRKSRFLEDMSEIVGAYLDNLAKRASMSRIVLRSGGLVRPIEAESIAYVEGDRKTQRLHLIDSDEVLTMRSTMQTLEEQLEPAGFIRIHQGYLVNYRQIKLISEKEAVLKTGESLPISRRNVAASRARYLELVQTSQMVF